MKIDYLCSSWQFLLQQLVYLVSKGYVYYNVGKIPENKVDKAKKIDEKIIKKYNIDLSKYQRARRKTKKLVNFYYLRWKNQFILLHTEGEMDVKIDDTFFDIRKSQKNQERLVISIGDTVSLCIAKHNKKGSEGNITVFFTNDTYKEFKTTIDELVKYKKLKELETTFKKLNAIPAWSGIVKQKFLLLNEMYNSAKKYNINTKKRNIIKYPKQYSNIKEYPYQIQTFRKPVDKNFKNDNIDNWI